MLEINEELFKAKNGGEYNRNDISNDFAIPGEITVTVTLNEYRALVSANAISEKRNSELNSKLYDEQAKANALKKEREKLVNEISELKVKISDLLIKKNTPPQDDNSEEEEEVE